MPRTISNALKEHLSGDTLTIAMIVKVTKHNGDVLGFTSHSEDILFEAISYKAQSTLGTSLFAQSAGVSIDNAEVFGGIDDERITAKELLGGGFDGADVLVCIVNWANLEMGAMVLNRYSMGEIVVQNGQFRTELRGHGELLKQNLMNTTSPLCRCKQLGDLQCKVPLASHTFQGSVLGVEDAKHLTISGITAPSGSFAFGWVEFRNGSLAGRKFDIKASELASSSTRIELRTSLQILPNAGDMVSLVEGCDRTYSLCVSKFSNGANFHGEPHLPGNDQVMQIGRVPN